ncbi:phosphate ABC transporter substrate-binding protein [Marinisporobacter balticus]|uniref:Phosphate ABC transporter substrate-binding protein (PhoT family) n=1 Tax=Marinisporobacter balticus TaxID=2018667 RepID=A0A4R2KJS6_9FIRM|nr:phosphate ABC transporter substrate-binding protein [Marinisporobacter balticus]TCO72687.1 phosphate ABC transporter substrate-binding protein (PhoT family) [Marinisporobacter balticus]
MKKIIRFLMITTLLFSLILTGCGNEVNRDQAAESTEDVFKSQILFKGSSTLAPVLSKISTEFIEEYETWDKVNKDFPNKSLDIFVSAGGSSAGVKSVIDGSSDFGMVSRSVSDEEKGKIEGYQEFKLGVDALTVSVNPKNQIYKLKKNLSTEEIQKIFSGEYKYWDQVETSLAHEEIVVVTRDLGGGAHGVFQKKVMGDAQVKADAIQAPSMGALVTKIIENKNAIGYASYGLVNQNGGKIIPLDVDGVAPTKENIISGDYKISRPLLVVKKGTLLPQEETFINELLSEEGMKTIERMGFVPAK